MIKRKEASRSTKTKPLISKDGILVCDNTKLLRRQLAKAEKEGDTEKAQMIKQQLRMYSKKYIF